MAASNSVAEMPQSYAETLKLLHASSTPPSEQQLASRRFLDYIYEQIDSLLNRCVSQNNSRSSTPSMTSKSTVSTVNLGKQASVQSSTTTPALDFLAQSANVQRQLDNQEVKIGASDNRVTKIDFTGDQGMKVNSREDQEIEVAFRCSQGREESFRGDHSRQVDSGCTQRIKIYSRCDQRVQVDRGSQLIKPIAGQSSQLDGGISVCQAAKGATNSGLQHSEMQETDWRSSRRVELSRCAEAKMTIVTRADACVSERFSNASGGYRKDTNCHDNALSINPIAQRNHRNEKNVDSVGNGVLDFSPLAASSPAHGKHRRVTLADFLTPDRSKKRGKHCAPSSTPQKSAASHSSLQQDSITSLCSSSCDSWAQSLSDNEITPLDCQPSNAADWSSPHCANGKAPKINCRSMTDKLDELSSDTSKCDKTKPSRRITPTVVSNNSHKVDFMQQAVFMPQSPKKSQTLCIPGCYAEERQRLKEKKAQLMVPISKPELDISEMKSVPAKVENRPTVEPELHLVTHQEAINETASMFARLVTDGVTEDATADLHLMLQLLCCQTADVTQCPLDCKSSHLLTSAHNGVYFSLMVLSQCQVLLNMMDSSVKSLLAEHDRVLKFNKAFARHLKSATESLSASNHTSSFSSVTFQTDTDNAKNFASDQNFIVFKKQRDLFYEIKRDWDSNNTRSGWSLHQSCSEKIYHLLNRSGVGLSNYIHLSRLFVNQLLLSCLKGVDEGWAVADEESITLLNKLKLSQPDRYMKLRQRFIKPSIHSAQFTKNIAFYGEESFFKQFIDVANDAIFIEHLKDALTFKLLTINQTEFDDLTDQDLDSTIPIDVLSDCVLTARLVAKFLGYLHFFPYTSNEKRTAMLDEQYGQLRSVMSPPLDVGTLLNKAISGGRCSVTIPWLVQYISQVDTYCIELPYYHAFLCTLHQLFVTIKMQLSASKNTCLLLQYVCLAWLFSLPQLQQVKGAVASEETSSGVDSCTIVCRNSRSSGVDSCAGIASIRLVYDCSQMLKSMKSVLLEYVVGVRSKVSVTRKITPITAAITKSHQPLATSNALTIQQHLEDSFFHNQQASLKKSVAYLAERVSSSYIKEFRAGVLANSLIRNKLWVHTQAKNVQALADVKSTLSPTINARCKDLHENLHAQAIGGVQSYFEGKVVGILELLLPSDTDNSIISVCSVAALRQGIDKVKKWLTANLTVQYLTSELTQEMIKFCRSGGSCSAPDHQLTDSFVKISYEHDDDAPSPCKTLIELQLLTGAVLIHPSCDVTELEAVLAQTLLCIKRRSDIECITIDSICFLLVVLIIKVATWHAQSISFAVLDILSQLCSIQGLQVRFIELIELVPDVEGVTASSDLYEKLCDYILFVQGRLSVDRCKE